ncbi:Protein mesA [Ceratocystis lukuohia]|uniref:Protein mesA n=1 Tax=Ceratocystis lukuohia TaxID=2019550 RepID=A0ABR4MQR4_9PEZI
MAAPPPPLPPPAVPRPGISRAETDLGTAHAHAHTHVPVGPFLSASGSGSSSSAAPQRTSLSSFPPARSESQLSLAQLVTRAAGRSPNINSSSGASMNSGQFSSHAHSNSQNHNSNHSHSHSHSQNHAYNNSMSHSQSLGYGLDGPDGSKSISQHSSLDTPSRRNLSEGPHPLRRLRSQYPRGSTENHVEYILVASFDIDRGPVMEHQYPVAITGDEHMLAELMLPDQAHMRHQDWTIFFLHKDISQEEEEAEKLAKAARKRRRQRRRDREAGILSADDEDDGADEDDDYDDFDDDYDDLDDDEQSDAEPEGGEGPPLIYVLNLVNTKQDKTVRRGAVVKAMSICTRHPFLHIYKPLLLLALEEYFKSPVPETLSMLYDAVNAMDLSLMPRLTVLERHLLQVSDNKELFVEKFDQMIQMRMAEDRRQLAQQAANGEDEDDEGSNTGAPRNGPKSIPQTYSVPRDTHEFESKVMYKGIPIPIKVPVAMMPESVGDFSIIKLIQNFSASYAKSPTAYTPHPHLTTSGPNTHPIIVLVNALLTQKRVIFLGHNMPSGDVAEAVLAACALASGGVLRGFTRHAFPYTDLTKIDDLLNVPGFIAGVTNPTFEMHPEWWDVLCDLPSGKIKISSKIEGGATMEGSVYFQQQHPNYAQLVNHYQTAASSVNDYTGDVAFMNDILKAINSRAGERVVRAKWRDWVGKFTRIAATFEETVYGASALYIGGDEGEQPTLPGLAGHGYVWPDEVSKNKELAGNVTRIEGWRNTRSYYSFIQDLAQLYNVRPLKNIDLYHMQDRLRTQRLTPSQSKDLYLAFCKTIFTYDEICLLLSAAPESHAGLFYLALGLFHKDREVRLHVADLLERISEHDAGRHWWAALGRFEKVAFQRTKRDQETEMRARIEKEKEGRSPEFDRRIS